MKMKKKIKHNQTKENTHIKNIKREKLNEKDIKELMQHNAYYRGKGGAIRQRK